MHKSTDSNLKRNSPDLFNETLRKTLENITDSLWIERHSPLYSTFFVDRKHQKTEIGRLRFAKRTDLAKKMHVIWTEWGAVHKTPLQALILSTIGHGGAEIDEQTAALLLLTYFDLKQPKQSAVIKSLAMSRATFYRYLERAVERLGYVMIKNLKPALKLEHPPMTQLIGRKAALELGLERLAAGQVVQLVGGSGTGKTVLGGAMAQSWPGPVFWYTFRPHLTDTLEQMLFALALFLHGNGVSALWTYLSGLNRPPDATHVLMILRQFLADQPRPAPLFAFDGVEQIAADRRRSQKQAHRELHSFFEAWDRIDRSASPLLLSGQQPLLPPDPENTVTLTKFEPDEAATYLKQIKTALPNKTISMLIRLTDGNPLLLRLLSHMPDLESLLTEETPHVTLDWFARTLFQEMTVREQGLLNELAIFPNGGPRDIWRRETAVLSKLVEQGLIEQVQSNKVALHPALQRAIQAQLPADLSSQLHLGAGNLLAERTLFTEALYHYIAGESPELGIWTWYAHRQNEMEQGQGRAALTHLAALNGRSLAKPEDEKALALLNAQLSIYAGRTQAGLDALNEVEWSSEKASSALALEYKGTLLQHAGDAEGAVDAYRASLDMVDNLKQTKDIDLLTRIARTKLNRQPLENEVVLARFQLDMLEGQIADAKGEYANARIHYANALALAEQVTDPTRLARLHEALGVMEARSAHIEAAVDHLKKSAEYHRQYGNLVCANGTTNSNISYTYLAKRRYPEAIEYGKIAYAFYQSINYASGMATNEANLAEASFYVGELEDAVWYAEAGLRREEERVRPYCLYVLGHVARVEEEWARSEQLCLEAISAAEEIGDPWAEAPAYNALGETQRDAGRAEDARQSHTQALTIWERMRVNHEVAYTRQLLEQVGRG
ncbi:MAG: tetratricopeptide repeat protein [Chloroflexota bacterium]